jgi:hypothetical protein
MQISGIIDLEHAAPTRRVAGEQAMDDRGRVNPEIAARREIDPLP